MSGWFAVVRHQDALRVLTVTDPLTGIYNRRGFLLLAEHQWELAQRKNTSFLLFYIDVARFKDINDSLGHKEGDLALRTLAAVLRESFRKSDIVGRIGGDEFAIAAIDVSPDTRTILEERLAHTLQMSNDKPGRAFQLNLNVGILTCDRTLGATPVEQLLAMADELMYRQKKGRATVYGAESERQTA
jgi:diguanylate cyclase (GGDEF)-like protein